MRSRVRKPSPAMVVAIAAIVMASTGSAIAAVSYASRAGAVDGFSAVGPRSSTKTAAGKLVATRRPGDPNAGKIPNKFLGQVPYSTAFGRLTEVADNAAGAAVDLNASALGILRASCNDQSDRPGDEDPSTAITFANTTSSGVNLARTVGNQASAVVPLPAGTQHSFAVNGSNTFELQVELGGVNVLYQGHVRQDGRNTPAGTCLIVGTAQTITP